MGKCLKMKEREMRELFENGMQSMRVNYYPACLEADKVIGLTPHSDGVGLTILLQVSDVEGLQVRKDGMWILVKPLPNSFIINIGDMLEVILFTLIWLLVTKITLFKMMFSLLNLLNVIYV